MGTSSGMINTANRYVGSNYKHFCDVANGGVCTQWCCAFVYTCAKESDNAGVVKNTISCTAMMNYFKEQGCFFSRTSGKRPQAGDLQFYDYDGDPSSEHIGIVTGVNGNSVTTVEGNMGNGGPSTTVVERVTYSMSYSDILGWARPKYGSMTTNSDGFIGPPTLAESGIDVTEKGILTEDDYGYIPNFDIWANIEGDNARYDDKSLRKIDKINKLRGIIGLPPQFLPSTDLRLGYSDSSPESGNTSLDQLEQYFLESRMGSDYVRSIAARMPIVYITPCEPAFLPRLSGSDRKDGLQKYVKALINKEDETAIESLVGDYSGKLYSVQFAYEKYFNYVNPACRAAALFLNLESDEYKPIIDALGIKPYSYNWGYNYVDDGALDFGDADKLGSGTEKLSFSESIADMQQISYYRSAIPFYANAEMSVSREFGNSTAESQLSSSINQLSDQARELQYILGLTSSQVGLNFDKLKSELGSDLDSLTNFVSSLPIGGNLFSTLVGGINTMIAGGRIIFPELWSDSDSSESYNINMKLIAPDPDNFSIWLYVIVPLIHIWALVSPRQADTNGYNSPFLVKAAMPGMFNVDMGIITSCSITIGKENTWNKMHLPTVVDVSISIKNLYNKLAMTDMTNMKYGMLENIAEMDFIANLCGINYNVPDTIRYIKMWADLNWNSQVRDRILGIPLRTNSWIDAKLYRIDQILSGR